MKWTGLFVSRRCLWLACWLTLLVDDNVLAKPRGTAESKTIPQRSPSVDVGVGASTDVDARSWRATTLATKVSSSSSSSTSSSAVPEAGTAMVVVSTKLTKSERLRRRKLDRKRKRLSKQQTMRKSKSRTPPASRHVGVDVGTRADVDADVDWSRQAPLTVNTARDNGPRYGGVKSSSASASAENDVLAAGKAGGRYAVQSRDLYSMVLAVESALLAETVRSRDAGDLLAKHSDWIGALNETAAENRARLAELRSQVEVIENVLKSEDEYHRSIEEKLSGLMLDVAEVNNLLATSEKRASTKLEDKNIQVESAPQVQCQHTANVTEYRDCEELYHHGHTSSGVYYIRPLYSSCPLPVYCDMDTPPGGWMVFQRRQDGSTNFTRNWLAYRLGFGDVTKEFWLGNDNLFLLTNQRHYQLRVDLWDFYGSRVFAEYLHFKVDGERDRYRLHVSNHTGTAPDSLHNHNEVYFSTPDRDNDLYPSYHCAKEWEAGWWFSNCWFAILNGRYHDTTKVEYRGISWNDWKAEQLQKVEMKMRPSGY